MAIEERDIHCETGCGMVLGNVSADSDTSPEDWLRMTSRGNLCEACAAAMPPPVPQSEQTIEERIAEAVALLRAALAAQAAQQGG